MKLSFKQINITRSLALVLCLNGCSLGGRVIDTTGTIVANTALAASSVAASTATTAASVTATVATTTVKVGATVVETLVDVAATKAKAAASDAAIQH